MKRYCSNLHVSTPVECTRATVMGVQRHGLHCPRCGLLTREVGDIRSLSPAHLRVLRELSTGDSSKEIAHRLNFRPGTLKVYVSRLYKATGTSNRVQLALFWIRHTEGKAISDSLRALGVSA